MPNRRISLTILNGSGSTGYTTLAIDEDDLRALLRFALLADDHAGLAAFELSSSELAGIDLAARISTALRPVRTSGATS